MEKKSVAGAGASLVVLVCFLIAAVGGELRNAGASPGEVFLSMTPVALAAAVMLLALARTAHPVE